MSAAQSEPAAACATEQEEGCVLPVPFHALGEAFAYLDDDTIMVVNEVAFGANSQDQLSGVGEGCSPVAKPTNHWADALVVVDHQWKEGPLSEVVWLVGPDGPDPILVESLAYDPDRDFIVMLKPGGGPTLGKLAGLKTSLSTSDEVQDADILPALQQLPHLRVLSLERSEDLTDAAIADIAATVGPRLEVLNLRCGITEAAFPHLATMKQLQHLDLTACEGMTRAGWGCLAELKGLTQLKTLQLADSPCVNDEALAVLCKELVNLEGLDLCQCTLVTAEAAHSIAAFPSLRIVGVYWCRGFFANGMVLLKEAAPPRLFIHDSPTVCMQVYLDGSYEFFTEPEGEDDDEEGS